MSKLRAKFIKAFRVDKNTVKCLYVSSRVEEFVIEWNNMHPSTGEILDSYDLQVDCLANYEGLVQKVMQSIQDGEDEDAQYLELYLDIRDIFDSQDCEMLV